MFYIELGLWLGIIVLCLVCLAHLNASFRAWFYYDVLKNSFLSDAHEIITSKQYTGIIQLSVAIIAFLLLWMVGSLIFLFMSSILGAIALPLIIIGLALGGVVKWIKGSKE